MTAKSVRHLLSLALCVAALAKNATADEAGTIQGTVFNEKGEAVAKALVNADPVDRRMRAMPIRYVETNQEGQFTIDRLAWGAYRLFAMKEQEGYANTRFAFYSSGSVPTISLNPENPNGRVSLRIGPKGGVLRILSVTDAVTGRDLNNVTGVDLRKTDTPETFIGLGPSDHILIPAETDVTMRIEAEGYEPWPPAGQLKLGQIRLASGQPLDLKIQLQPLSGLSSEIERMIRRAADANRIVWTGKKSTGPLPPPEGDIERLQQLGDTGIQALAQYLQPDKDGLHQGGVISLLASLGGDQALDLLDEFAQRAQEPEVRISALKRLSASGRAKDIVLLQQVSTADPDTKVRETAAKLLQLSRGGK